MPGRISICQYCGRALTNAETGRPRRFCNDLHRKWYDRALVARGEALLAEVHPSWAAGELRDLQGELARVLEHGRRLAAVLDPAVDVVALARVSGVVDSIELALGRHFGEQENGTP